MKLAIITATGLIMFYDVWGERDQALTRYYVAGDLERLAAQGYAAFTSSVRVRLLH